MAEDVREADDWQKREHDAVFQSLDKALRDASFPAGKSELAQLTADEPVSPESDLRLVKYIEALPDRTYQGVEDVKRTLDERWQDLLGYRDAGYEARLEGGGT